MKDCLFERFYLWVKLIHFYEVGSTTMAYVDPQAPDDAFLNDTESNSPLFFVVVGGLFLLINGELILNNR